MVEGMMASRNQTVDKIEALSRDSSTARRLEAARALPDLASDHTPEVADAIDRIAGRLVEDPTSDVRHAAEGALAAAMRQMTGLAKSELVARWATSHSRAHRTVIGRAISAERVAVVGEPSALEHLADDEAPEVREAAEEGRAALETDPAQGKH